jgi:hypothetical protein
MNKKLTLLFRGQRSDQPLLPTLLRAAWRSPTGEMIDLERDRQHYLKELGVAGEVVYRVMRQEGLPRWRMLDEIAEARWAVIQHYELWPTPLLDFTRSLRIAATFAIELSGGSPPVTGGSFHRDGASPRRGFVYVIGVDDITSDPMDLRSGRNAYVTGSLSAEMPASRWLPLRLDAVCPPRARRPHLQEGFLVGRNPFKWEDNSDVSELLIAKLEVVDDGSFWDDDFPPFTRNSLLPDRDQLRNRLLGALALEVHDGRATLGVPTAN